MTCKASDDDILDTLAAMRSRMDGQDKQLAALEARLNQLDGRISRLSNLVGQMDMELAGARPAR